MTLLANHPEPPPSLELLLALESLKGRGFGVWGLGLRGLAFKAGAIDTVAVSQGIEKSTRSPFGARL